VTVHKPVTAKSALEKKIRWMTLGGQYDWTNKLYPPEQPPEFPSDIADLLGALFPDMEPQAAIVNLYSPGDTLSLHRDVSEEVDRGLVSISLGCDAVFIIGLHDEETHKTRSMAVRLRSGDALYMTGESRFAWHAVPCIIPDTCPSYLWDWPGDQYPAWKNWMQNKRINLNVRQMRNSSTKKQAHYEFV
jgi:alkylated DNA repair protein alkB family protein 1